MPIYKIIKISLFLGTGILVACSPDKSETKSSAISSASDNIKIQQAFEAKFQQSDSLQVYVDPKTGEFVDAPIENSATPGVANSVVTTVTPAVDEYTGIKESADTNIKKLETNRDMINAK